jgi:hypothetical protein
MIISYTTLWEPYSQITISSPRQAIPTGWKKSPISGLNNVVTVPESKLILLTLLPPNSVTKIRSN